MSHDYIPLIIAGLWPAIIILLLLCFYGQIRALLSSVTQAKIGNILIAFGQAPSDDKVGAEKSEDRIDRALPTSDPKRLGAETTARENKTANIFWLGSDLEWTTQTLLRGAPKDKILHGLDQCCHHSSEVGLADSAPARQLVELRSQVKSLPEAALVREWRSEFSEKIYVVIKGFSDLLRGQQPGFRPNPN